MSRYFIFIPNFLSIIRIGLVYPILMNIHNDQYLNSLLYFILASVTDALDGFLARRMSWQTDLGKILDPVADKLLLSGSIFVLWLNDLIPFYVFFVLLARDVIILLGASIHMSVVEAGTPFPESLKKVDEQIKILEKSIWGIRDNKSLHNMFLLILDVLKACERGKYFNGFPFRYIFENQVVNKSLDILESRGKHIPPPPLSFLQKIVLNCYRIVSTAKVKKYTRKKMF